MMKPKVKAGLCCRIHKSFNRPLVRRFHIQRHACNVTVKHGKLLVALDSGRAYLGGLQVHGLGAGRHTLLQNPKEQNNGVALSGVFPTRIQKKEGFARAGNLLVPLALSSPSRECESVSAFDYVRVVGPTAMAMLLMNIDRICMSIAIIPMAAEFGWQASVQGIISASFLWGYMATQLLAGSLADRFGAKITMAVGIAWFSCATMLMPTAVSSTFPL